MIPNNRILILQDTKYKVVVEADTYLLDILQQIKRVDVMKKHLRALHRAGHCDIYDEDIYKLYVIINQEKTLIAAEFLTVSLINYTFNNIAMLGTPLYQPALSDEKFRTVDKKRKPLSKEEAYELNKRLAEQNTSTIDLRKHTRRFKLEMPNLDEDTNNSTNLEELYDEAELIPIDCYGAFSSQSRFYHEKSIFIRIGSAIATILSKLRELNTGDYNLREY